MAPSYMLRDLSGTTRSSLIPMILPRPPHSGQAPSGLLKENRYSSGSLKVIPSISNLFEYSSVTSSFFSTRFPFPSRKAVSTELRSLVSRSSHSSFVLSPASGIFTRSTNSINPSGYSPPSASFIISSMRTMPSFPKKREYPSSLRRSISSTLSSRPSQLKSARIYTVLQSPERMLSMTSLAEWHLTSLPLTGEYVRPILAKIILR